MAAQTTGTAAAAMLSPNPATASLELAFHVVLAAEQRKAALKDKGQRMRRAPMQGVTNGTARAAVPSATAPEPQPLQTRSFSARVVNLDDLPSVADEVHSVAMVGHPPFQAARLLDLGSEGLTRSSLEAPVAGGISVAGRSLQIQGQLSPQPEEVPNKELTGPQSPSLSSPLRGTRTAANLLTLPSSTAAASSSPKFCVRATPSSPAVDAASQAIVARSTSFSIAADPSQQVRRFERAPRSQDETSLEPARQSSITSRATSAISRRSRSVPAEKRPSDDAATALPVGSRSPAARTGFVRSRSRAGVAMNTAPGSMPKSTAATAAGAAAVAVKKRQRNTSRKLMLPFAYAEDDPRVQHVASTEGRTADEFVRIL